MDPDTVEEALAKDVSEVFKITTFRTADGRFHTTVREKKNVPAWTPCFHCLYEDEENARTGHKLIAICYFLLDSRLSGSLLGNRS